MGLELGDHTFLYEGDPLVRKWLVEDVRPCPCTDVRNGTRAVCILQPFRVIPHLYQCDVSFGAQTCMLRAQYPTHEVVFLERRTKTRIQQNDFIMLRAANRTQRKTHTNIGLGHRNTPKMKKPPSRRAVGKKRGLQNRVRFVLWAPHSAAERSSRSSPQEGLAHPARSDTGCFCHLCGEWLLSSRVLFVSWFGSVVQAVHLQLQEPSNTPIAATKTLYHYKPAKHPTG